MIYSINRERLAWKRVIPFLQALHNYATQWRARLLDSGRSLGVYRILQKRNDFEANRADLDAFKTANWTWFGMAYPDHTNALTGAISSLGNLVVHIDTLVAASYTDAETSEPILMNVTQGDRDTLASDVSDELQ